jgi:hypothetical protein
MLRLSRSTLLLAATVVVSACASVNAGSDYAAGLDLKPYATFDWGAGDTLPAGDPRLDNNPFFDARVRAAVERELATKGITRRAASPDLLIHYHASVRQRVDVIRSDEVRGYTFGGVNSSEKVIEYEEGTLILDIAEAKSKRILWRGWAQTDVDGIMNEQREMEKRIDQSVRKMLEQLPRVP